MFLSTQDHVLIIDDVLSEHDHGVTQFFGWTSRGDHPKAL